MFLLYGILPKSFHSRRPMRGWPEISTNEQCDLGGTTNGKECVPLYGEDCPWCDSSCGAKIMIGEKCGDGVLNGPEQCDDGVTNGQPCDPEYLGGCTYCGTDCKVKNLVGTHCGDGVIQTDKGEECDLGTGPNGNGKVCTVPYNGAETCTYCSPGMRPDYSKSTKMWG